MVAARAVAFFKNIHFLPPACIDTYIHTYELGSLLYLDNLDRPQSKHVTTNGQERISSGWSTDLSRSPAVARPDDEGSETTQEKKKEEEAEEEEGAGGVVMVFCQI